MLGTILIIILILLLVGALPHWPYMAGMPPNAAYYPSGVLTAVLVVVLVLLLLGRL